MGDEMPADPFRDGQPDWGPLAANNFSFFSSPSRRRIHESAGTGPDGPVPITFVVSRHLREPGGTAAGSRARVAALVLPSRGGVWGSTSSA